MRHSDLKISVMHLFALLFIFLTDDVYSYQLKKNNAASAQADQLAFVFVPHMHEYHIKIIILEFEMLKKSIFRICELSFFYSLSFCLFFLLIYYFQSIRIDFSKHQRNFSFIFGGAVGIFCKWDGKWKFNQNKVNSDDGNSNQIFAKFCCFFGCCFCTLGSSFIS